MKPLLPAAPALALILAACSAEPEPAPAAPDTAAAPTAPEPTQTPGGPYPSPTPSPTPPANTLTLEGLGDLRIGAPIPAGSTWGERGAQSSDRCRTVSSPDFPGVYAIVEGGLVRRISVGERSDVRLIEGIGSGASEADVLAAFPGFVATPHKYVGPPAKDLTQPGNDPRLRFEIGADRRVSIVHVGAQPQLGYVEGCS